MSEDRVVQAVKEEIREIRLHRFAAFVFYHANEMLVRPVVIFDEYLADYPNSWARRFIDWQSPKIADHGTDIQFEGRPASALHVLLTASDPFVVQLVRAAFARFIRARPVDQAH